mmetsp:Transcript_47856/g.113715  ORF Transcript_47856/g.113715 Transcript_47856/m.113715 type:complete len:485 (-) Transcript_47856:59-1513(-)
MLKRAASQTSVESFFEQLPAEELLDWELELRGALLRAADERRGLAFPLLDWIDSRVGGDIALNGREIYRRNARLAGGTHTGRPTNPNEAILANSMAAGAYATPPVAQGGASSSVADARVDAFFARLPAEAYNPEEELLRTHIGHFLASWRDTSTLQPTLQDMEASPEVHTHQQWLPRYVSLRQWVEQRMGQDLALEHDAETQQDFVTVQSETFRQAVNNIYHENQRQKATPEDFFESLSRDSLSELELQLRKLLLDCIRATGGRGVTIKDAVAHAEVRRLKRELLPEKVNLRDWIDRRVGRDISCTRMDGAPFHGQIVLSEAQTQQDGGDDLVSAALNVRLSEDEFFMSLPEERFLPAEQALRDALIGLLHRHGQAITIATATQDAQVDGAIRGLLGNAATTLEAWMARRIGGEVSMLQDPYSGEPFFGLHSQISAQEAALPPPPHQAQAAWQQQQRQWSQQQHQQDYRSQQPTHLPPPKRCRM